MTIKHLVWKAPTALLVLIGIEVCGAGGSASTKTTTRASFVATRSSADMWMRLQAHYEPAQARRDADEIKVVRFEPA